MKNNSKHFTLILFGIIAILASGFGYLYMHNTVITQAERYAVALKDSETYKENKKNEQNLQKIYKQTIDDRAKLNSYIVTEDKIVDFIESLEGIGKITNTKVNLSSINSDEMKTLSKGEFGHIKARFEVEGSWSSVMSAISIIENLPFSITLSKSRLFNGSGLKNRALWNLSTEISVLSVK